MALLKRRGCGSQKNSLQDLAWMYYPIMPLIPGIDKKVVLEQINWKNAWIGDQCLNTQAVIQL